MTPTVSVITVVYNDVKHIEGTIQSVLSQTYSPIEYIIIDGGSTDGTIDVICDYENRVKWKSEPDKGIYDAMMKGVQMASGTWLLFLNSGDYLYNSHVLKTIFTEYVDHGESFLMANGILFKDWGYMLARPHLIKGSYYQMMPVLHPSTLVRRDVQMSHPFRQKYKLSADYCFFLEILMGGATYRYFNLTFSCVNVQEGATARHWAKSLREDIAILRESKAPKENIQTMKRRYYRALLDCILLRLNPNYQNYCDNKGKKWGWVPTEEPIENRYKIKTREIYK